MNAVKQGKHHTLHYYVVWKGQGHRSANFLLLWKLKSYLGTNEGVVTVYNNILEMFMCRVFQSLPFNTLKRYSGINQEEHPTLGLNIVPPLLQSRKLSSSVRHLFNCELQNSPDQDVREWPSVRESMREPSQYALTNRPSLSVETCRSALRDAVAQDGTLEDNIVIDLTTGVPQQASGPDFWGLFTSHVRDKLGEIPNLVLPVGCPETARVGIMLDEIWIKPAYSTDQGRHIHPPWGIRESGFNDTNCLIWAFDFKEPSIQSTGLSIRSQTLQDLEEVRSVNSFLISNSSLRVILLCGENAHRVIQGQHLTEIRLELQVGIFNAYIEIETNSIKRIYINCPAPLSSLATNNFSESSMITDLFRFAALVTQTPGISAYFSQNCGMVNLLLELYEKERNGAVRMTGDNIDPKVRHWLYRKGFTEPQHINELEKVGDSLIHSCIILLHVLPRCPAQYRGTVGEHGIKKSQRPRRKKLDEMNAVTRLLETITRPTGMDTQAHTDPDYVPDVGEIIEEVLLTGQGVIDSSDMPLRRETANLLTRGEESPVYGSVQSAREIQSRRMVLEGTFCEGSRKRVNLSRHICLFLGNGPGWDHDILVQAEVAAEGTRHPQFWAKKAMADDPAGRLAFKVTYQPKEKSNEPMVIYPPTDGEYAVHKANAFVDWFDGATREEIAENPKRHLHIDKSLKYVPENLEFFRDGAYTDERMRRFKINKKKKRLYESLD
jgi:hypothetical protein